MGLALSWNGVQVENSPTNKNPPSLNAELEENVEVRDVEENGQEKDVL